MEAEYPRPVLKCPSRDSNARARAIINEETGFLRYNLVDIEHRLIRPNTRPFHSNFHPEVLATKITVEKEIAKSHYGYANTTHTR